MKFLEFFVYIFIISTKLNGIEGSLAEQRLLSDIFTNYSNAARPALHDEDTVNVTLGLTLSQIIDVHEKSQILVISVFIRQIWHDPNLAWDRSKYNNISAINVDPKLIWKPDIVLYNNADEDKNFGGNLDRLNTRAILNYTGEITWLAPIILKSQCPIDVKHFPFDTQHCRLKFGSWTYNMKRLNLLNQSANVDLSKYSTNSEWFLVSAIANRTEEEYTCCPGIKFPDVTYIISISRRSLFYLCNLIFPMVVIGMLTILSFLLPAESGERISLAITLLLAMTVFMLVVADIIPATSDVIPLVGIFFSASMIEMVIMIVVLCYIMRLHHKDANDPPMSLWMRRFFLDYLSYKLHIRKQENKTTSLNNEEQSSLTHPNHNKNIEQNMQPFLSHGNINLRFLQKLQNQRETKIDAVLKNSSHINGGLSHENQLVNRAGHHYPRYKEGQLLLEKVDVIISKLHENDRDDEIKTEWRIVAMTIDRCLLIFFAFVFIVTMFACFSKSPGYVP